MSERIKDGPPMRFELFYSTSNGLPTVTMRLSSPTTSLTMSTDDARNLAAMIYQKADAADAWYAENGAP